MMELCHLIPRRASYPSSTSGYEGLVAEYPETQTKWTSAVMKIISELY